MSDQHKLYINGEWIQTEASVANVSPSDTKDVIGQYAQASAAQVQAAISAANTAVAEWGQSALETRYTLLMDIGNELIARSGELGELLAREEGKRALRVLVKSIGLDSSSTTLPLRSTVKSTIAQSL